MVATGNHVYIWYPIMLKWSCYYIIYFNRAFDNRNKDVILQIYELKTILKINTRWQILCTVNKLAKNEAIKSNLLAAILPR